MIKHMKNAINPQQREDLLNLVAQLKDYWFVPKYKGTPYRYKMANVGEYGWYTDPNRYETTHNGEAFLEIPQSIVDLAHSLGLDNPQVMLVNQYKPSNGRLGLHQDKDETARSPIISLSLGCSGTFITASSYYGEQTSYTIEDGDIFIFGESDRMIWHGIQEVINDHPIGIRLNFTIREVK